MAKEAVTVKQLLSHQAGLCALDKPLTIYNVRELDELAHIIAHQKPLWSPGTRHGYHAVSLGWYEGELVRRVDPRHRSLGRHHPEWPGGGYQSGSSWDYAQILRGMRQIRLVAHPRFDLSKIIR
jgi:hypothetical protein